MTRKWLSMTVKDEVSNQDGVLRPPSQLLYGFKPIIEDSYQTDDDVMGKNPKEISPEISEGVIENFEDIKSNRVRKQTSKDVVASNSSILKSLTYFLQPLARMLREPRFL